MVHGNSKGLFVIFHICTCLEYIKFTGLVRVGNPKFTVLYFSSFKSTRMQPIKLIND